MMIKKTDVSFKHLTLVALLLFISTSLKSQIPSTLSPSEKVFGLSKFWQEVNYNFVYLDKIDRKLWDSTYLSMIKTVQETPNDYEYFRELQRFCALLKDGHTNVWLPPEMQKNIQTTMFGDYNFALKNIEGKAIIVDINPSKRKELPVGSEIIEVNGLSTASYIEKYVSPYISTSSPHILEDLGVSNLLEGLKGDSYSVKVRKPNGVIIPLKLTHADSEEKLSTDINLFDFKWENTNTAYLALNSFSNPEINDLFLAKLHELQKAKSLIIDLRENGGGNSDIAIAIYEYLTTDSLVDYGASYSRINKSIYKALGHQVTEKDTSGHPLARDVFLNYNDALLDTFTYDLGKLKLKLPKIIIPTVLLIGHNTASAAEDFLIYADKQTHMVKIGENTYGSTGQPYNIKLVGGGSARICIKKDTYSDGREFVGTGILPDIEIKPTLKNFLKNKDEALDAALTYLENENGLNQ